MIEFITFIQRVQSKLDQTSPEIKEVYDNLEEEVFQVEEMRREMGEYTEAYNIGVIVETILMTHNKIQHNEEVVQYYRDMITLIKCHLDKV